MSRVEDLIDQVQRQKDPRRDPSQLVLFVLRDSGRGTLLIFPFNDFEQGHHYFAGFAEEWIRRVETIEHMIEIRCLAVNGYKYLRKIADETELHFNWHKREHFERDATINLPNQLGKFFERYGVSEEFDHPFVVQLSRVEPFVRVFDGYACGVIIL